MVHHHGIAGRHGIGILVGILLVMVPLGTVLADAEVAITVAPIVAPTVSSSAATNVTHTSGTLPGTIVHTGNDNPSVRGFEWGFSTGNYTASWNETGDFGVGDFVYTVTNLTLNTEVFWRAFAINDVCTAYSSERSFTTLSLPYPPTDFEITQIGVASINITWTKGIAANITIVRASTLGYPFSVFDGNPTYSGNGTYVEVNDLDLANYTYYFRAWSQNEYGTSTGYAQDSIGHGASEGGNGVSIFTFSLTGDSFGLLEMILVIALMGFAFWRQGWIRVVLSLGIITWGVFAANYDIKVAAPLFGIGTLLFIMGIVDLIGRHREEKEST